MKLREVGDTKIIRATVKLLMSKHGPARSLVFFEQVQIFPDSKASGQTLLQYLGETIPRNHALGAATAAAILCIHAVVKLIQGHVDVAH